MAHPGQCAEGARTAQTLPRLWLGLLCLVGCQAASALSPDVSVSDLRRTVWGPKEGATGAAAALAQTSDGYVWVGNAAGLTRFDGLRFEHIDLPRDDRVSSANVWTLFAPESGGLWIGFTFGGVAFLTDGKLTAYSERDGLPPGSVKAIAFDHEGTLWVATTSGLAKLQGSRWHKVGPEQGYFETQASSLLLDSAGTLWTTSQKKALFLPAGEKMFREAVARSVSSDSLEIAESPTGEVWLTEADRFQKIRKNENRGRRTSTSGKHAIFDRDGGLWATAADGALRRLAHPESVSDSSWVEARASLPSYSEEVAAAGLGSGPVVLEDREGNVWTASATGLKRYSERNVTPVLKGGQGFSGYSAAVASGDQGAVWIAGRNFAPFSLRDSNLTHRDEIGVATCAFRAEDGSVWFGGRKGLWKYASGRLDHIPLPEEAVDFEVQAMTEDRAGNLWVSVVRKGVYRLAQGTWTAYGGIDALPKLTAVTLTTDAAGRVWFGYTEGRVAVLDGGRVIGFSDQVRLPVGNITAIYGRGPHIWAGGEFGLAVLDGPAFRAVSLDTTAALNGVTGIAETAAGDLWLNGSLGVVHVSASEVGRLLRDKSYRPHAEVFDGLDGVEGSAARLRPLPTLIEGSDSRIWFLTDAGLYAIDPARIHRNPLPPPVVIESLIAGDKNYEPASRVNLPKGATSLQIVYAGLSLTASEKVRYRYRLEGVDDGWQDAQRRRAAFYTNLRPGLHRFQVIASNNDGVWNETGATIEFVIPPTFVQTGWFIALCAVSAGLSVWLLIRLRVRQVAARMRVRFAERMAERERIARELHDTLLQSTQGLILRFQAVANRVARDDPSREMLDEALERADAVMAEGRDRVLDLRVSADPRGELPEAFASTGEELGQGRSIAFRAVVEGTPRGLQPVFKDEIYRIGREALLNAFRHSQAASIEVQIIYADHELRVRIRDDGIGLQPRTLETGSHVDHWGLQGMRERAKRIGVQFDLWSRPGAGTEIELTAPAAAAYLERRRRSRWWPLGGSQIALLLACTLLATGNGSTWALDRGPSIRQNEPTSFGAGGYGSEGLHSTWNPFFSGDRRC